MLLHTMRRVRDTPLKAVLMLSMRVKARRSAGASPLPMYIWLRGCPLLWTTCRSQHASTTDRLTARMHNAMHMTDDYHLAMTTPDAHIVRSGKRHLKVTHFTPTV